MKRAKKYNELKFIGGLELGNDVIATDPCYEKNGSPNQSIFNVKSGKYSAYVQYGFGFRKDDIRVARLFVVLEPSSIFEKKWMFVSNLAVDSGQCGIFDYKYYQDNNDVALNIERSNKGFITKEDLFYDTMCHLSMTDDGAGVYKHGVSSSSGIGDGLYAFYIQENRGKCVAFAIDFALLEDDFFEK